MSDIEKANDTPVSITFTPDDFKNRFIGDMLAKVRISSLPSHGTLKLGQNDVSAGQEIRLESVDDLIFHPVSGYEGQDSFGWNGSNGNVYATVGASVNMTIISGGRVLGFSKTNDGALLIPFTLEEFSGHFDGDDLVKIRVTSLPLNGRVRLGESEVAENQEILLDDLNRLTYHPDPEFEGEDRFEWNGSNGTFYAENGASVSLTITVMPGDINYDGGVDLKDAIIGLQILAGILPMELTSPAADVNGDGRIGLEDVVHIFMVMTKSS